MFGTDAVVEGVELFPSMLGLNDVTLWTYLAPPAAGIHRKRLTRAQTHFKREITKNEFEYVRAIDRMLRMECRRFKIPVLSSAPLRVLENQVVRLLNESKLRPDSNNADRS
jgi:2-phosphoglycerate kinase